MANKRDRIIYIDDEEYVWCSMEQEFIIGTNFHLTKSGNYKMFCIDCANKTYDERHERYSAGHRKRRQMDKDECKMILENLGYKFNTEYTIHQQFLIKHNLI